MMCGAPLGVVSLAGVISEGRRYIQRTAASGGFLLSEHGMHAGLLSFAARAVLCFHPCEIAMSYIHILYIVGLPCMHMMDCI